MFACFSFVLEFAPEGCCVLYAICTALAWMMTTDLLRPFVMAFRNTGMACFHPYQEQSVHFDCILL